MFLDILNILWSWQYLYFIFRLCTWSVFILSSFSTEAFLWYFFYHIELYVFGASLDTLYDCHHFFKWKVFVVSFVLLLGFFFDYHWCLLWNSQWLLLLLLQMFVIITRESHEILYDNHIVLVLQFVLKFTGASFGIVCDLVIVSASSGTLCDYSLPSSMFSLLSLLSVALFAKLCRGC